MDEKALALTKAIRRTETGGHNDPYNAQGKSGEFGAYQFLPSTYKSWAKTHLGDENAPMTVENQNKIAYSQVKAWKDQGLSPAQIASAWNSGDPNKYKTGGVGVNSMGVAYNVPDYVSKVSNNYRELAGRPSGQPSGQQPVDQQMPSQPQTTKFDVPGMTRTPEQQAIRQENARQAMVDSQLEARKANNPFKILKDTILGIPKTIFNSAANLGKTLGESLAASKVADDIEQANQLQGDSQFRMLKEIQRVEQSGGDATRLKQIFNQQKSTESVADIAPSINKSNAQVMGEIGGTAIDLLTAGYGSKLLPKGMTGKLATKAGTLLDRTGLGAVSPELSAIASQQAKGLFTKQGVGNVLEGAGLGYASDVAQGLQGERGEDRMGKAAFAPGLGTLLGAGIPAIAETSQSFKNIKKTDKSKAASISYKDEFNNIIKNHTPVYKNIEANKAKGFDFVDDISNDGELARGIKPVDGRLDTSEAVQVVDDRINNIEDTVSDIIPEIDKQNLVQKHTKDDLSNAVNAQLADQEARGYITREESEKFSAWADSVLTKQFKDQGSVNLGEVDKLRQIASRKIKEFYANPEAQSAWKALYHAMKEEVYAKTAQVDESLGFRDINKYREKLIALKDFLENRTKGINGRIVKGGRLGTYSAKMLGGIFGAASGNPILSIVGSELAGRVQSIIMDSKLGGSSKAALIKKLTGDPDVVQKLEKAIPGLFTGQTQSKILKLPEGGKSSYKPVDSKIFVNPQGQASDSIQEAVDANSPAVSSRLDSPNMSNEVALSAINDERTLAETAGTPDVINAPDIKDDLNFLDKSDDIARREEEISAMQGADDFANKEEKAAAKKLFDLKNRLKEREVLDGDVQGYKNGKVDQRAANRNALVENYASARGEAGMGANFDNNAQYANEAADKYGAAKEKKKSIFQQMKEIAQQKKLLKEEEKRLKNMGNSAGTQMLAGGVGAAAGIERDEEGNITGYNMEKGIKGGVSGLGAAMAIGSIKSLKPFSDSSKDELTKLLKNVVDTKFIPQKGKQVDMDAFVEATDLMNKIEKGKATNADYESIPQFVRSLGQKVPILERKVPQAKQPALKLDRRMTQRENQTLPKGYSIKEIKTIKFSDIIQDDDYVRAVSDVEKGRGSRTLGTPIVVEKDGKYYVEDGRHRLADAFKKDKNAEVKVSVIAKD